MNTTSLKADEYDKGVGKSVPLYAEIHSQILGLVAHAGFTPALWLDAGCGTGSFTEKCAELFPETRYIVADPSEEMLTLSRKRLIGGGKVDEFINSGTEGLTLPDNSLSVVTAILSHHYLTPEAREKAVRNCARMLSPGGMYIAIENVGAFTAKGKTIALARWRDYQISAGKTPEKADHHLSRYGKEFFPINPDQHLDLLKQSGFSAAEIFWYSYSQIGVYGIK